MSAILQNGNGLSPESTGDAANTPYLEIVEQPASKALRFRYECEGRSAGSIPGVHNTPENKTYPKIRIVGYHGRAVIVVSCVTKDEPYRAHPHNLVGKEGCRDGICTMEINNESMEATFSNLGIQCVKKKDIEDALIVREKKRVDPFRHGFTHRANASSIDLNAVRLCFQAFLPDLEPKKFLALPAVVSEPIFDKKAMSDLVITRLSHSSAPAVGGLEMILLCEKVAKEDIHVRFFEERNGQVVWEGLGDFSPNQVHKQVAIYFKTPPYHIKEVDQKVKVFIQLKRPSDGATSEPVPFHFISEDSGKHAFRLLRSLKPDYDTLANVLADVNHPLTKEILALRRSASPIKGLNDEEVLVKLSSNVQCSPHVACSDDDDDDEDDDEEEKFSHESTDSDENDAKNHHDQKSTVIGVEVVQPLTPAEMTLQDAIENLSTVTPDKLNELGLVFTDEIVVEPHDEGNSFVEPAPAEEENLSTLRADGLASRSKNGDSTQPFKLCSNLRMAIRNTLEIPERITFANESNMVVRHYEAMAAPPRPASSKPDLKKSVVPNSENEQLPPLPPKRAKKNTSSLNRSLQALPQKEPKLALFQKLFFSKKNKKSKTNATAGADENDNESHQSYRSLTEFSLSKSFNDDCLTEAEHYALYTAVAPRATDSEFDENSCYYSPVEAEPVK